MQRRKKVKLIVSNSDCCREILIFIDSKIDGIKHLGVDVAIEKIDEYDEELIEYLRKKGIPRLPALLTPDGAVFIGIIAIKNVFSKNLKTSSIKSRFNPEPEGSENLGLSDYWASQMYDRAGRPREDGEEDKDAAPDYSARCAAFKSGSARGVPEKDNHETRDTRETRDIPRGPRRAPINEEDNIESPEYDRRSIRQAVQNTGGGGDDDLDQKMMEAWMENNAS